MAIISRPLRNGKMAHLVRVADYTTGKRRNVTIGTFPTKKQAERAERDALNKRDSGASLDSTKLTIGELMDTWYLSHKTTISTQSAVDYEATIRLHIKPMLGHLRVSALTPAKARAQYLAWAEAGKSADVIQKCHQRLNQALDQAVEDRAIQTNPLNTVKPPRSEKKTMHWYDRDEARAFLTASRSSQYAPVWHLLLLEGMRVGEALGLRWSDLHVSDDGVTAHIQQQVAADKANKGKAVILPYTKTNHSARTVRLADETAVELKAHRKRQNEERLQSDTWEALDLITCTENGGIVSPSNVDRAMRVVTKTAGITKRIRVHDLRHTCATLLLQAGIHSKAVSERLGHASIRVTLDLYSHVMPDMQKETASAWSGILPAPSAQAS
jgi:integrase